ncbi:nuclear transport factor 2 family protein [Amycolatopsis sp. NPDC003731]
MDEQGQVAEALAAERESLRPGCRADTARFARLLAPDFHEFGKSGGEFGHEEALRLVANSTDAPITVENLRGSLVADGVVLVKYTSEHAGRRANRTSLWRRVADGHWQIFHHQGTPAAG